MMPKKLFLILLFFILSISTASSDTQPLDIESIGPIKKDDRVLILAPHPDDETIGCAGVIQQALNIGAQVKVVYLTNGDHNEISFIVYNKNLALFSGEFIALGQLRRKEAVKAMGLLGLDEKNLIFLGYPDFGTFAIFNRYWQDAGPYMSLLTRISSVPYKENLTFGAPYKGESILSNLKCILLSYRPTKIFVSHPADVNVDHKAFYLFLQVALADLGAELTPPEIYPYLIHNAGWPLPRHYHPQLSLVPPQPLLNSSINWVQYELTPEQLEKKYQATLCYRSQTSSSAFYLLAFARKNELFGDFPESNPRPSIIKNKWLNWLLNGGIFGLDKSQRDSDPLRYSRKGDFLLIRILKSKKSTYDRAVATIYLFPYNYREPFSSMPKLRIVTKHTSIRVFDREKLISWPQATAEVTGRQIIVKLPIKLLGEPDFLLISVRAYTGSLPIYYSGFRKVNLRRR